MSLPNQIRSSRRRSLFAAAVMLFVPSTYAGNFYGLGSLGTTSTIGESVNASGQVVGQSSADIGYAAFLYLGTPGSGGAMVDLGTLGGANSNATSINNAGQITGSSGTTAGPIHAFRYSGTPGVNGAMLDLGTLPGGSISYGIDINATGQVAGDGYVSANTYHAIRYTGTPGSGGAMTDLGTLGGTLSEGYGINASGQVVGNSLVSLLGETVHAFRTNAGTNTMVDLGTLGGNDSFAFDINDPGVTVGTAKVANGDYHAFRYAGTPGSGGAMADLGVLPGGLESTARGINKTGEIVGYSSTATAEHAFLYTGAPGAGGKMIDLDAWLNTNNPAEGAKWTLSEAYGINDLGMIAGQGVYNDGPNGLSDGTRAFRLDVSALIWQPGDADRDHDVDFADLLTLAQNYGATSGKTWSTADFTFDGAVNFSDLLLLAQNYGKVGLSSETNAAFTGTFAADWALAQSLVPEPASLSLLVAAGTLAIRRRRSL